jgi:hypothetical protein
MAISSEYSGSSPVGKLLPVACPFQHPETGITRLKSALNFTSHTPRMDIADIPDQKMVAECATWKTSQLA